MTWTKLDQDWLDSLFAKGVSRDGVLVAVEALVWSNRVGVDGAIARGALGRMTGSPDPEAAMAELVAAGEATVTEGGWQITDAIRDQLSSEDVGDLRERWRERQERSRRHKRGDHSMCNTKYCDRASRVTSERVSRDVTRESRDTELTRTDPDRTRSGEGREGATPDGALSRRASVVDDETRAEIMAMFPDDGGPLSDEQTNMVLDYQDLLVASLDNNEDWAVPAAELLAELYPGRLVRIEPRLPAPQLEAAG